MASKEPKTPSTEEQGDQSTDSVFDFLYYDARRIASFLAQFDNSGHLTGIVQNETAQRSKQSTGTLKASGGVLLAKASGEHSHVTGSSYQRESQRVYDPTWANARAFLDHLAEHGLTNRDIGAAGIGQFVLSTGALSISDLQLMHKTWQLPSVKKQMRAGIPVPAGNRKDRRKGEAMGLNQPTMDGLELFWDMVTILPHTIQARLKGDVELWCSLHQEGLSVEASDITLKHGTNIPGDWSVLGILDARPDNRAESDGLVDFGDGSEMAVNMMGIIAPIAQNLLGRPKRCYGVTPLLVFREITG